MMEESWRTLYVPREIELAFLKDCWAEAKKSKPVIAAIVAESGYGKTRLAQEFFGWLSTTEDQPEPTGYWPDRLGAIEENLRVNPDMPSPLGESDRLTSIPFLWWGTRIADPGKRNQLFVSAISQSKHDLAGHLQRYQAAHHNLRASLELKEAKKKLFSGLAIDVVSNFTFNLLGTLNSIKEYREEVRQAEIRLKDAVETSPGLAYEIIETIISDLRTICKTPPPPMRAIPIVLLVDDLQWIQSDPLMLAFLDKAVAIASAEDWPILFLVTCWEREWYGDKNSGIRQKLIFSGVEPREIAIGPLELQPVVQIAMPGLTFPQVAMVIDAAEGNPLYLGYLIDTLVSHHANFVDRSLQSTLSSEGENLVCTITVQEIIERRFLDSPEAMQFMLGIASLQGIRFSPSIVVKASKLHNPDVSRQTLQTAERPYAFVSVKAAAEAEFRQRKIFEMAGRRLSHFVDLETARTALIEAVSTKTDDEFDEYDDGLLASYASDHNPDRRNAAIHALERITRRALENGDSITARNSAETWLDNALRLQATGPFFWVCSSIRQALKGTGRASEFVALLEHYFNVTYQDCLVNGQFDMSKQPRERFDALSGVCSVLASTYADFPGGPERDQLALAVAAVGQQLARIDYVGWQKSGQPIPPETLRSLRISLQRQTDWLENEDPRKIELLDEQMHLARLVEPTQTACEAAPDIYNTVFRLAPLLKKAGFMNEARSLADEGVCIWERAVAEREDHANLYKLVEAHAFRLITVSDRDPKILEKIDILPILHHGYHAHYLWPRRLELIGNLGLLAGLANSHIRADIETRSFAKRLSNDLDKLLLKMQSAGEIQSDVDLACTMADTLSLITHVSGTFSQEENERQRHRELIERYKNPKDNAAYAFAISYGHLLLVQRAKQEWRWFSMWRHFRAAVKWQGITAEILEEHGIVLSDRLTAIKTGNVPQLSRKEPKQASETA